MIVMEGVLKVNFISSIVGTSDFTINWNDIEYKLLLDDTKSPPRRQYINIFALVVVILTPPGHKPL